MPQAETFLQHLFGSPLLKNFYSYLWRLDNKTSYWFKCGVPDFLKQLSVPLGASSLMQADMYVGLCPTMSIGAADCRVTKSDATVLPHLWLDVDVWNEHRGKDKLPRTTELAIEGIAHGVEKFDIPAPSITVDSGYGLHLYWLFEKPYVAEIPIAKAFLDDFVYGWNSMWKAIWASLGYDLDSTSPSQVLRVPGFLNHKHGQTAAVNMKPIGTLDGLPARYDSELLHSTMAGFHYKNTNKKETKKKIEEVVCDKERPANKFIDFTFDPTARLSPETIEAFSEHPGFERTWTGVTKYPSQSERDCSIAAYVLSFGGTAQEAVDAMVHNRAINDRDMKRRDYYQRTLLAASIADINDRGTQGPTKVIDDPDAAIAELSTLLGIEIVSLTKYLTSPPTYRIEINNRGKNVSLAFTSIKELRSQTYFTDRLMEVLDVYIKPMTKKKWAEFLSILLPLVTNEDLGPLARDRGGFRNKVNQYLDYVTPLDTWEKGQDNPVQLSDGTVYIDITAFHRWHNREGTYERMALKNVVVAMAEIGGKAETTEYGLRMKFNRRKLYEE